MGLVPLDSLCSKVSFGALISWKDENFFVKLPQKLLKKAMSGWLKPELQKQKSRYKKKKKKNSD
jgi:hypothetical protein